MNSFHESVLQSTIRDSHFTIVNSHRSENETYSFSHKMMNCYITFFCLAMSFLEFHSTLLWLQISIFYFFSAWEFQQMHLLMKIFIYSFSLLMTTTMMRWKWEIRTRLRLKRREDGRVNQYWCFQTTTIVDNVGCCC